MRERRQMNGDGMAHVECSGDLHRSIDGMGALQCGDDAFESTEELQPFHGLSIGTRHVLGAAALLEVRMLRSDARIVEASRDRVRLDHLQRTVQ